MIGPKSALLRGLSYQGGGCSQAQQLEHEAAQPKRMDAVERPVGLTTRGEWQSAHDGEEV